MLNRSDAIVHPYIRKYIVMTLYRVILKEKKKTFDPIIAEHIQLFQSWFKEQKSFFSYHDYSKSIRTAEYYARTLCLSNSNEISQRSLKASKDLLKISYRLKPSPFTSLKVLTVEENYSVLGKVLRFDKKTHQFMAYRMAFGLPTRVTKEESLDIQKLGKDIG